MSPIFRFPYLLSDFWSTDRHFPQFKWKRDIFLAQQPTFSLSPAVELCLCKGPPPRPMPESPRYDTARPQPHASRHVLPVVRLLRWQAGERFSAFVLLILCPGHMWVCPAAPSPPEAQGATNVRSKENGPCSQRLQSRTIFGKSKE